jgi:hypothetical protein
MNSKCEVEGCNKPWVHGIWRTKDGKKEWLHVCILHTRLIGDENEKRCYCPKHPGTLLFAGVCIECDKLEGARCG